MNLFSFFVVIVILGPKASKPCLSRFLKAKSCDFGLICTTNHFLTNFSFILVDYSKLFYKIFKKFSIKSILFLRSFASNANSTVKSFIQFIIDHFQVIMTIINKLLFNFKCF